MLALNLVVTVIHSVALQLEIELSQQRHEGDLKEKNRLSRMVDNKASFKFYRIAFPFHSLLLHFPLSLFLSLVDY